MTATRRFARTLDHIRGLAGRPGPADDERLLHLFLDRRDEAAFAELVRRHGPRVLGVARRRLGDGHGAEDVFQATFLALARAGHRLARGGTLAGWLYTVAFRLACKEQARMARRPQPATETLAAAGPDPLAEISGRELVAVIDEEIAALPERYRLPLLLCGLDGLSRDEAAARLGWSLGTLRGRLERGRERLRGRLAARGLTASALLASVAADGRAAVPAALAAGTVRAALTVAPPVLASVKALAVAGVLLAAVGVGTGLAFLPGDDPRPQAAPPPPVAAGPRADSHGDPLPDGAAARLGTMRFRHEGEADSLAYSPDGTTLAARTADGTVILWDARTGRERRRIHGMAGQSSIGGLIAFSPDGKLLAAPEDAHHVRLWDVATGQPRQRFILPGEMLQPGLPPHDSAMHTVRFSPDGQRLAVVAAGSRAFVFDVSAERPRHHFANSCSLTFAPDSRSFVCQFNDLRAEVNRLQAQDAATGAVLWTRDMPAVDGKSWAGGTLACDIAFSPDGKTLATGWTDKVLLWDAATGAPRGSLDGPMGQIKNLAFTPDGRTLCAGGETGGKVYVWDVATRTERQPFGSRIGILRSMALSPDGKTVAAAGVHCAVRLWDVATGRELFDEREGPTGQVNSVAYSPDGKRLVSAGENGQVWVWDTATGKPVRRFQGTSASQVAYSPDGRQLALVAPGVTSRDRSVRVWDAATGEERFRTPLVDRKRTTAAAYAKDGKTLVTTDFPFGGPGRTLNTWDATTGRHLRTIDLPAFRADCLALSPDGTTAAVGGTADANLGRIRLYDLEAGTEPRTLPVTGHLITALAFAPDGRTLVSGGSDHAVRLWEVATGREVVAIKDHERPITAVAFSPYGRLVASASGSSRDDAQPERDGIRLWDATTGREVRRWQGHSSVTSLAFSPDGSHLASGLQNGTVLLWEVLRDRRGPATPPGPKELESLWSDLAGDDIARVYRALGALADASGSAVAFVAARVQPAAGVEAARVASLIADLDSDKFAVRQQAERRLAEIGSPAVPHLKEALAKQPTAEMRQRLKALLDRAETPAASGEEIRALRVVGLLERIGTPEARQTLQRLAAGSPDARLTREAKSSLGRLSEPRGAVP